MTTVRPPGRDTPAADVIDVTALQDDGADESRAPQELRDEDLHSDEIRAIMGAVPHWTVRSGQSFLLGALLLGFLLARFIRYPEQIDAPIVLTAEQPPANVVARSQGYLVLGARDAALVREGEYLGHVTNAASVDAVQSLKGSLTRFERDFYRTAHVAFDARPHENAELGDVQGAYDAFVAAVRATETARRQRSYQEERAALARQLADQRSLMAQTEAANAILREELASAATRFRIDSTMYARKVESRVEYEEKRRSYLGAQREYGTAAAAVANLRIAMAQLEDRMRESAHREQQQDLEQRNAVETAMKRLQGSIESWERSYLLVAPTAGRVALHRYWTDHQYVKEGEDILTVIPDAGGVFGRVEAPMERSGKLRAGQTVDIRFADYPAEEYGVVRGIVRRIAPLPRESSYSVDVALPGGLTTTYGRRLDFRQDMRGTAAIVVGDASLLDRMLYSTRRALAR